jgi:cystathionine gamma-synthase
MNGPADGPIHSNTSLHPATKLAQGGHFVDPATGAIVPAVHPSTTFARDEDYSLPSEFSYARAANPNTTHVERLIAELEGGADTLVFASGMAGISTLLESVPGGKRIAAPSVMYHGARDWMNHIAAQRGVTLDWFDPRAEGDLEAHTHAGDTALIWIETAVNPTWDVIDIAAAANTAHAAGARLAVDATVSPPVTCTPLALGADYVFHSATKYLNGHSDVTAGVVTTAKVDDEWRAIQTHRTLMGGIPGPFETWLLMRGLRTLALRFERASANAQTIAQTFHNHSQLEAVLYPGLATHPRHDVAARQLRNGFGGMLSLMIAGGSERALAVAGKLKLFVRATSLGGVESLVEHRATVEGLTSPVPPQLLRMSIGIEAVEDLVADIEQALE